MQVRHSFCKRTGVARHEKHASTPFAMPEVMNPERDSRKLHFEQVELDYFVTWRLKNGAERVFNEVSVFPISLHGYTKVAR